MSAPTGPMDPERLASVRNTIGGYEKKHVAPFLVELLAAHDHLANTVERLVRQEYGAVSVACDATGVGLDAVRATAASRAAETLRRDPIALAAVDREAEIKRLQAEITRLEDRRIALEAEAEGLRNVARGLAKAVSSGCRQRDDAWVRGAAWRATAQALAEDVIEADARGAL